MASKDKADEMSKEGAARVAIYKETGLPTCWTLECNYNSCKVTSLLPKVCKAENKSVSNNVVMEKVLPQMKEQQYMLNVGDFESIGVSIVETLLDFYELKRESRVYNSKLKNMDNIRLNLGVAALRMIPFRFDNSHRKLINMLNSSINTT